MNYILGYDRPIPGYIRGAPAVWQPTDVAFLAHPELDDEAARREVLPPWLRRRRVRVGVDVRGRPLKVFADLPVAVQIDLLEAAEDWTTRPPLLVEGEDRWGATMRAVRLLAEHCPEVFVLGGSLVSAKGAVLGRNDIALLLSRTTGENAPPWLLDGVLNGSTLWGELPPWRFGR